LRNRSRVWGKHARGADRGEHWHSQQQSSRLVASLIAHPHTEMMQRRTRLSFSACPARAAASGPQVHSARSRQQHPTTAHSRLKYHSDQLLGVAQPSRIAWRTLIATSRHARPRRSRSLRPIPIPSDACDSRARASHNTTLTRHRRRKPAI
jgi:hypothetical protein